MKEKETVLKREVSCSMRHGKVTWKSRLKNPICPVCGYEVPNTP